MAARKPARPWTPAPELADIRREFLREFGEEIAYAIRPTAKDVTPAGHPTWDPLPVFEALRHIDGILSERFFLRTPIKVEVRPAANGRWIVRMMDERRWQARVGPCSVAISRSVPVPNSLIVCGPAHQADASRSGSVTA